jgi:hypothetical protein
MRYSSINTNNHVELGDNRRRIGKVVEFGV